MAITSQHISGLILTMVIAAAAYALGTAVPMVGGAVFGILLGIAVKATGLVSGQFRPGIQYSSKQILQIAIVLMGTSISFRQVVQTGLSSLSVTLITLSVCLGAAWLVARWTDIRTSLVTLIGVGTGICGASAIAATAPVIQAEEDDVAYAISTIFAYNVAAVLIFPVVGHLLGMSQEGFGLWAGTAVNDTSSVIAAAYSFGTEAGAHATVVKLARATLIVPVVLGLAYWQARGRTAKVSVKKLIPWFILFFLGAALINSFGLIPAVIKPWLPKLGKFLIVMALTAVGLSSDFRKIARTGPRPLLLGAGLWILVAVTSLIVQAVTDKL